MDQVDCFFGGEVVPLTITCRLTSLLQRDPQVQVSLNGLAHKSKFAIVAVLQVLRNKQVANLVGQSDVMRSLRLVLVALENFFEEQKKMHAANFHKARCLKNGSEFQCRT